MLKAVIFDLDGTLADTIDDIGASLNRMLALHGFPVLSRDGVIRNINHGPYELVKRSLPCELRDDETLVRQYLSEYDAFYGEHYMCDTRPYPGIREALARLEGEGLGLAVLSNKQDAYVKKIIATLFPDIGFREIRGVGELPPKPEPTSALLIAEKLGAKPYEVAFVGDSHIDMLTACNAGMYPVGVCWGYRSEQVLTENGARLLCHEPSRLAFLREETVER